MLQSVTSYLSKRCYLHRRCIGFVHNILWRQYHDQPSTQQSHARPPALPEFNDFPITIDSESIRKDPEYFLTYIELINFLTENKGCRTLGEAKGRIPKVLKHTIPYGRQFEGIGVVNTYKLIESSQNLTPKNIKLANVLSWCTAMQTACYLIDDDLMDGETIRFGAPCWHTLPGNATIAVNDSYLVQNAIFVILKKYFSMYPCYIPIMELFNTTNYAIALGQTIDNMCKINEKPRFEDFTRERYEFMVQYKACVFAHEFTLKIAMLLANRNYTIHEAQIRSIMSKVGLLYILHDDLRDSLSELFVAGKRSTDISNGKCTWLALEALERGTLLQKQLFMEYYGKPCIKSETIIQNLYKELNLSKVYEEIQNKLVKSVYEEAKYLADIIPEQVFFNFLSDVLEYKQD